MKDDSKAPIIIKGIGIFMVFIGVIGTVSGLYALTLVKDYTGTELSRDASKSIVEASTLLTRDKNNIKDSLENTKKSITEASGGLEGASADLLETSKSLEGSATNIEGASNSISASAQADKDAATQLKSSADAMDTLWGPTAVAVSLRAAADKMQESASNMEATSASLKEASTNTMAASSNLKDTSKDLDDVSADLNESGDRLSSAAFSVDAMTTRIIENLSELLGGLQWLETADKKTILYEIILYFIIVHILFGGTGVALILLAANIYGW
jgi:chromosome segregation ATPase